MEERKAIDLSIKTVILLMIGALVVLSVMGAWSSFEDDAGNSLDDSSQQAEDKSSYAACALNCRQENLGGGGGYESCVQGC